MLKRKIDPFESTKGLIAGKEYQLQGPQEGEVFKLSGSIDKDWGTDTNSGYMLGTMQGGKIQTYDPFNDFKGVTRNIQSGVENLAKQVPNLKLSPGSSKTFNINGQNIKIGVTGKQVISGGRGLFTYEATLPDGRKITTQSVKSLGNLDNYNFLADVVNQAQYGDKYKDFNYFRGSADYSDVRNQNMQTYLNSIGGQFGGVNTYSKQQLGNYFPEQGTADYNTIMGAYDKYKAAGLPTNPQFIKESEALIGSGAASFQDIKDNPDQVPSNLQGLPDNNANSQFQAYDPKTGQLATGVEAQQMAGLDQSADFKTASTDQKVQVKNVNGETITVYESSIPQLIQEGTLPPGASPAGQQGGNWNQENANKLYQQYIDGGYTAKEASARVNELTGFAPVSQVEQQAKKLGNTTMANQNYVNAVFQQLHGRDATQSELDKFSGNGVLDIYNAIKAGAPIKKSETPTGLNVNEAQKEEDIDTTIAADRLGESENKLNLPGVEDTGAGSTIVDEATQTMKTMEQLIKENTPPETEADKKYDDLSAKISDLLGEFTDKADMQLAEESKRGLDQLRTDYAELNAQILSKTAEYEALKTNIEGKPITMSSIIGQQAQVEKAKLAEIGLLQARALGLQGQIDTAQAAADRAVDLKYSTLETTLKVYELQINLLKDDLDDEEKVFWEARKQMLAQEKAKLDEQKATEKNIQNIALTVQGNGGDMALAEQIANAGSEMEAMAIAGQLALGSGWKYVSTPAERDALKAQGYEITQAGGRTYARPTEAMGDILSPSEAKKLGVPYGTTRQQAIDQGITPQYVDSDGGNNKQNKSQWSQSKANQLYNQYIEGGYSPQEAINRVQTLTGYIPKGTNFTAGSIPSELKGEIISNIQLNASLDELNEFYPDVSSSYLNSLYNQYKKEENEKSEIMSDEEFLKALGIK